jgi:hypothetical protein
MAVLEPLLGTDDVAVIRVTGQKPDSHPTPVPQSGQGGKPKRSIPERTTPATRQTSRQPTIAVHGYRSIALLKAVPPIVLDEQSSGHSVHLRIGQSIEVRLPGGSAGGYAQPSASSNVVRRVLTAGGYPTALPVRTRFDAIRPGTAEVTSTTDYACIHTSPACLLPQRDWTVHVTVTR